MSRVEQALKKVTVTALGWALLGLVGLGIVWVVVTGLLARATLDDVRHELPSLRHALTTGDSRTASTLIARIRHETAFADDLTSGPAWWVGAQLPYVGSPLQTSRAITEQVEIVGDQVLPAALQLSREFTETPPPHNAKVDLAQIERVMPTLASATRVAERAEAKIAQTEASWLPVVSDGRSKLLSDLTRLTRDVSGADDATQIALPMLGQQGLRRYFVGFFNEAESRGLGGLPGTFAIVTADNGQIRFEHFGSDIELRGVASTDNLGAEYQARYPRAKSTTDFRNSTVSPDFRDAGRIWASMWQNKTGEHIDGAIALDPTTLSYVLKVTGPYKGPRRLVLTAKNVVELTQQRQYQLFPSDTKQDRLRRKQFLVSLAVGLSQRLSHGGDARKMISALARAAHERRLMVWSADPALEKRIIDVGWGGVLAAGDGAYTGFTINNASGSKLDYYVERRLTYRRSSCAAGGTAVATFTLHSTAPKSGLPPYVTIRLDPPPPGAHVGDELLIVTYYGSPGARITRMTVNGRVVIVAQQPEKGLVAATLNVELAAGATVTVQATVQEPVRRGPTTVLEQPLVRPMSVSADSCA